MLPSNEKLSIFIDRIFLFIAIEVYGISPILFDQMHIFPRVSDKNKVCNVLRFVNVLIFRKNLG